MGPIIILCFAPFIRLAYLTVDRIRAVARPGIRRPAGALMADRRSDPVGAVCRAVGLVVIYGCSVVSGTCLRHSACRRRVSHRHGALLLDRDNSRMDGVEPGRVMAVMAAARVARGAAGRPVSAGRRLRPSRSRTAGRDLPFTNHVAAHHHPACNYPATVLRDSSLRQSSIGHWSFVRH